jgi:hypothetical protein
MDQAEAKKSQKIRQGFEPSLAGNFAWFPRRAWEPGKIGSGWNGAVAGSFGHVL